MLLANCFPIDNKKMKTGDRVNTIDGFGIYLGDDCSTSNRSLRHKVRLDVDSYKYDSGIVCYWPKEMRPLETKEGEQLRTTNKVGYNVTC